jgi:hypothetical protein
MADLFLTCDECKSQLENPLIVPCGSNICKKHDLDFDPCKYCSGKHSLPLNENIKIRNLLYKYEELSKLKTEIKSKLQNYQNATSECHKRIFDEYFIAKQKILTTTRQFKLYIKSKAEQSLKMLDEEHESRLKMLTRATTESKSILKDIQHKVDHESSSVSIHEVENIVKQLADYDYLIEYKLDKMKSVKSNCNVLKFIPKKSDFELGELIVDSRQTHSVEKIFPSPKNEKK